MKKIVLGILASLMLLLVAVACTGAEGPQGATGPRGETGAAGPRGAVGPQGETGAQGSQGLQGPRGATGPRGPTGFSANTDALESRLDELERELDMVNQTLAGLASSPPTVTGTPPTMTTNTGMTPAVTPTNTGEGRIAFASDRDGDFEIYTMNPDGSDVRQVTNNDVRDWQPTWSPDGTRILWLQGWDIVMRLADGTGLITTIIGGDFDLSFAHPRWLPSGNRILYTERYYNRSQRYRFRLRSVDGLDDRVAVSGRVSEGSQLSSISEEGTFAYTGSGDIYTGNLNGSFNILLTTPDTETSPTFSPDRTRLAFASDAESDNEIYVRNEDGTTTQLTMNIYEDLTPAWSP